LQAGAVAHLEVSLLVLLAVAAAVARISLRVRMPYSIGLVVAGLLLGNVTTFSGPTLTKDLLFLVVLPGLLFEGAFELNFGDFWQARYSILTLAVPGLVAATVLTAMVLWLGVNRLRPGSVTLEEAMAFGALISATDPISVLSLFRSLGVDSRLCVMVEGEALFNDGTAVVLFGIVLGFAAGGGMSWTGAGLEFLRVAGLAALVGAAIGFGSGVLTRAIDDAMVEITVTLLCAYGAFISAELLGLSGVIACVVSGLIAGTWGARGMRPSTRGAVDSFWSYAAFLLNSIVFLLIGKEIHLGTLAHYAPQILVGWLAINAARAAVLFTKYGLMRAAGRGGFPLSWATTLTWGGLRGGLSMVLAVALPTAFPHREMLVHTTYGVVLLSLLVQGLTMKPLLRALGLAGGLDGTAVVAGPLR
jgi:CPA1 family monovalent cation:H+ antiporter